MSVVTHIDEQLWRLMSHSPEASSADVGLAACKKGEGEGGSRACGVKENLQRASEAKR